MKYPAVVASRMREVYRKNGTENISQNTVRYTLQIPCTPRHDAGPRGECIKESGQEQEYIGQSGQFCWKKYPGSLIRFYRESKKILHARKGTGLKNVVFVFLIPKRCHVCFFHSSCRNSPISAASRGPTRTFHPVASPILPESGDA